MVEGWKAGSRGRILKVVTSSPASPRLLNVITAAIVYSMADLVRNILLASSLSFLGLGT